ncbi:MAG: DUF4177 domain-containing protein [Clostridia bacterium]|nr:DUF4177 domain-containing protein [Clostridia bacterium]
MKSSEIASKYGISSEYALNTYIKKHATFPIKENFWGDIILPDDIDIDNLVQGFYLEKEEKVKQQEEEKRQQEERDRKEWFRQQQEEFQRKQKEEQHRLQIEQLKAKNLDGYYEYKVISLSDIGGLFKSNSGRVDIVAMTQTLNELGIEGWHLITAYSNELGKNALSGGAGGVLLGINSTVDENILIFERFVRIS